MRDPCNNVGPEDKTDTTLDQETEILKTTAKRSVTKLVEQFAERVICEQCVCVCVVVVVVVGMLDFSCLWTLLGRFQK